LDGVLREFIAVRAEDAVHAPANLSDVEVATLPIAAVTAWATLREGGVKTGDGVLAMGTGGVAIFTLQFAKLAGAQVVVISSSDDKLARVRKLGADATISYRTNPDWAPLVRQATNGRGVNISRCGCRSAEFLSNVICITRTQAGGEYGRPVPLPTLPRLAARFPKGRRRGPLSAFWPRSIHSRIAARLQVAFAALQDEIPGYPPRWRRRCASRPPAVKGADGYHFALVHHCDRRQSSAVSRSSATKYGAFGSLSDFVVFNTSYMCSASTMPMAWIAS
jgi:Zinc-binding dehydrogenase